MRRSLPGQLDHIRDQLTNVAVLIIEAARDADARAHSRWVHSDLVDLGGDVAELVAKARELRAEMLSNGLGSNALALGAPIPLVLKRPADEFDEPRRLGRG